MATKCAYCGQFRGSFHACAAKRNAKASSRGRSGTWGRLVNAFTGNNKVKEGAAPDLAANRDRRLNEGGIFQFSSAEASSNLRDLFLRKRLPLQVGEIGWVRLYEGSKKGSILEISEDRVLLEFPPQYPEGEAKRLWYQRTDVWGEFDPADVNDRTLRQPKSSQDLGVIRKNSRISVAFYDTDVEGVVLRVRGTTVDFIPDGSTTPRTVSADICTLLDN